MEGRFLGLDNVTDRCARVLVAMSGGVDSAVTALLLKRAGYRVVGVTMKNYCYGDVDVPDRSCCSIEAIDDARRECDRLEIPHRVADVEGFFTREVIDDFVREYENARTPNPCVRCNSIVRFETLLDLADKMGIDYVATGHYARVFEARDGNHYLARSPNRAKDQSYFLSGLHGDTLRRVLFPLGDYDKGAVRRVARNASMRVAEKKESQEVCFVPDGTLRSFLESRNVEFDRGRIENRDGELLGHHDGLAAYTVGQRRHLGIALGEPQYVLELDRERNVLVVGDADELLSHSLRCRFTWLDRRIIGGGIGITAQIRHRHESASIERVDVNGVLGVVDFAAPQRAVCPGQTIAFYHGDLVVASGVIDASGAV